VTQLTVLVYATPEQIIVPTTPTDEMHVQEQRERAILATPYAPGESLPTGDDAGVRVVSQDSNTRMMNTNPVYRSNLPPAAPPVAGPPPSVTDLLNNLGSLNLPNLHPKPQTPYGAGSGQGHEQQGGYQPPPQQAYGQGAYNGNTAAGYTPNNSFGNNDYNNNNAGFNRGFNNNQVGFNTNNNDLGFKGGANNRWANNSQNRYANNRGRGGHTANHRTRVCKFWLQGRCYDGDKCTFLHDQPR
jgi:hypothetical protein